MLIIPLCPATCLLSYTPLHSSLQVADFGFSARVANEDCFEQHLVDNAHSIPAAYTPPTRNPFSLAESPVRQLRSVVGSPYYIAPEVIHAHGYNGLKSDMYSVGVILYAMLAGGLPFDRDLTMCKRFVTFSKWMEEFSAKDRECFSDPELLYGFDYPTWFFPSHFSAAVKGLIVSLLHPDPELRLSVVEAQRHPWVTGVMGSRSGRRVDAYPTPTSNRSNSIEDDEDEEAGAHPGNASSLRKVRTEDEEDDGVHDTTDGSFVLFDIEGLEDPPTSSSSVVAAPTRREAAIEPAGSNTRTNSTVRPRSRGEVKETRTGTGV